MQSQDSFPFHPRQEGLIIDGAQRHHPIGSPWNLNLKSDTNIFGQTMDNFVSVVGIVIIIIGDTKQQRIAIRLSSSGGRLLIIYPPDGSVLCFDIIPLLVGEEVKDQQRPR